MNLFQKLCEKMTNHKYRRFVANSIGIAPTEYHYRCKICNLRFWNHKKPDSLCSHNENWDDCPNCRR